MSENNSGTSVAAFLAGALAGAGIALLLAPKSGKDTRDLIARRADDLKDRAEQALSDAKSMLNSRKTEITAAVEAAKDAVREERSRQAKVG
ncbi:MAG: YtxH domain-containing protein [Kiritimatiellia bacterium]